MTQNYLLMTQLAQIQGVKSRINTSLGVPKPSLNLSDTTRPEMTLRPRGRYELFLGSSMSFDLPMSKPETIEEK